MDRSFLSSDAVIEASRNFICIRLATYEDAQEAEFLKNIFQRGGALENTVFCFLAPDGEQRLTRASRGARMNFSGPQEMAQFMNQTAFEYPGRSDDVELLTLPQMKNLRLALNVAACDGLPLVIVSAAQEPIREKMASRLANAAIDAAIAGKFHFYAANEPNELIELFGMKVKNGYHVIQPDTFGLEGQVVASMPPGTTEANLVDQLATTSRKLSKTEKSHRQHVRDGSSKGITWETEIPVTDAMANRARESRQKRARATPP